MTLKRLDNIGVAVTDLQRAHAFYHDVLGMDGDAPPPDAEGFSVRLGDVALYVFRTSAGGDPGRTENYTQNPPGLDHLSFEVADFDARSSLTPSARPPRF